MRISIAQSIPARRRASTLGERPREPRLRHRVPGAQQRFFVFLFFAYVLLDPQLTPSSSFLPLSHLRTSVRCAVHSVLRLQSSYRPDRARARAFPSSTSSSELQFKSLNGGRRLRMDMPNVHDEKPKVRVCMRHMRLCS